MSVRLSITSRGSHRTVILPAAMKSESSGPRISTESIVAPPKESPVIFPMWSFPRTFGATRPSTKSRAKLRPNCVLSTEMTRSPASTPRARSENALERTTTRRRVTRAGRSERLPDGHVQPQPTEKSGLLLRLIRDRAAASWARLHCRQVVRLVGGLPPRHGQAVSGTHAVERRHAILFRCVEVRGAFHSIVGIESDVDANRSHGRGQSHTESRCDPQTAERPFRAGRTPCPDLTGVREEGNLESIRNERARHSKLEVRDS